MKAHNYRATASEAQVLQAVMRVLRMHAAVGCWWRANSGAANYDGRHVKFGVTGQSDLMVVLRPHGRLCCLEVKRPGAKPTPEQTAFLRAVERSGGVAAVVHSVEETTRLLDAHLGAAESFGRDELPPERGRLIP